MKVVEHEISEQSYSFDENRTVTSVCPECDRKFPLPNGYFYCPYCGSKIPHSLESWPNEVESWVSERCVGSVLNICCGNSKIGFRVDLDKRVNPNLIADLHHLPFQHNSFDTVLSDPPFSYYGRGRKWFWLTLKDIARKRLILSTPTRVILMGKKRKKVNQKRLFAVQCSTNFLRLFQIFDFETILDEYITKVEPSSQRASVFQKRLVVGGEEAKEAQQ